MPALAGLMTRQEALPMLRFAAPQVLTSIRIVLAVFAILFAMRQQTGLSATLLLLGLPTDAVDGACARMLGVASEFGKLFDFFADFLYFVLAPAIISLAIVQPAGTFAVLLLSPPCVFAGLRYACKALVSETEYPGIPGSPGVPAVAYALLVNAVALLEHEQALPHAAIAALLVVGTPLLGLLMISQTRYPKLSVYLWILVPILVGLMIMPFVRTAILSAATLLLIAAYVLIGPELVHQPATRSRPRVPVRNPCS